MEIYSAQSLGGRTPSQQQSANSIPVRSVSPDVSLAVGNLLAGRVSLSTPQLLTIALTEGGQIQLPGGANLVEGDSITIRVATLKPQIEVTLARTPEGAQVRAADLGLNAGQTTTARVVGQLAGQQAVVEVNGQQITLAVPGDVQAGSLLPVRIDEEGGRVYLTVLSGAAGVEVLAQHYLREQDRPRDALGKLLRSILASVSSAADDVEESQRPTDQLRSLLQRFQPGPQTPPDAIERGLEDGGLLLESRLAKLLEQPGGLSLESDLKALLLQLTQSGEADGDDTPLLQLARQALSQIEQLQLTNALNQLHDSALVWQLPGWPGSSAVYLRIEPDDETYQEDESAARAWQVLLAVDLDDVGPVRVDARLQGRTLRVILFAPDEMVAALNGRMDELHESLAGDDFDQVLLGVQSLDGLSEKNTLKINRTIEALPENWNALDVSG